MAHSGVGLEFMAARVETILSRWDWYLWTKRLSRSICQHLSLSFLWSSLPASQHLDTFGMEGRRGERRGGLVSSLPSHSSPGGLGLVCDLVSHMIETHLILLGINILQRKRGDSRREKRGEDERQDGWVARGIFEKLYLLAYILVLG